MVWFTNNNILLQPNAHNNDLYHALKKYLEKIK